MKYTFSWCLIPKMVKSLVLDSFPGTSMRILSRPNFTNSPALTTHTIGQPLIGQHRNLYQYVPMQKTAKSVTKMLELPEGRDLSVIAGYSEMVKNRTSHKSTPDEDLKSASKEYFDSVKLTKDNNFEPATEKSSVTEKNEAETATALAVAQEITPKKTRKPGKGVSKKKGKNVHFKIVNKKKKK